MKLTPEQKAFYEYGEARGILKERKSLMRFKEGYGECSDYHGELRIMYGVEDAIRDAWQKRAACRAWLPMKIRSCNNCRHRDASAFSQPCYACSAHNLKGYEWEPRKEGES